MAFNDLLNQTCDIARYTSSSVDLYGNPVKSWSTLYDNEPCRLSSSSGREIKVNAEVVIANYKLFIDDTVGITEQDRVTISGITYEVLLVESFQDFSSSHHKQCFLQAVR